MHLTNTFLLSADIYFYQEDTDEDPESGEFLILS